MFSTTEHLSHTTGSLLAAQSTLFTQLLNAMIDAGMNAAENNADTMRTVLAKSTVAGREWYCAGNHDWLVPLHRERYSWSPLAASPTAAMAPRAAVE